MRDRERNRENPRCVQERVIAIWRDSERKRNPDLFKKLERERDIDEREN